MRFAQFTSIRTTWQMTWQALAMLSRTGTRRICASIMNNFNAVQKQADQGDFYWANFIDPRDGNAKKRPVFIVGKNHHSNDHSDVIICVCTTHPGRTSWDIPVPLKKQTTVRTNKLFTISRAQLDVPVIHSLTPTVISSIFESVEKAVKKQ